MSKRFYWIRGGGGTKDSLVCYSYLKGGGKGGGGIPDNEGGGGNCWYYSFC